MGIKNAFYRKNHSQEYLSRKRKSIIQISDNDDFIKEWNSIDDACKELNLHNSPITLVLNNKQRLTKGFKYKNNER